MNKYFTFSVSSVATFFLLLSTLTVSCSKKSAEPRNPLASTAPDNGFSTQVQQIISVPILDSLKKKGMTINEGVVPPKINNMYYLDPNIMVSSYGPEDTYKTGDKFVSYYYKFYDQDDAGNIKYDEASVNLVARANAKGSVISGYGNKFTIFSQTIGTTYNIPNKTLAVISGELTANGDIKNWQNALIMVEKTNDVDKKLIEVGKNRIFKDGDGTTYKTNYFPARLGAMSDDLPAMGSSN
ncbi:hypothetical protein [Spirosoma oryzicola]|uniref:hypothetical protein n=1 Tax=Spirosoma oryzicola TaxID=2898794 RepID=UPI001E5A8813|nr:hypothetical protein [Spirosoma oryzicola]UHG93249.1 hypothetical protein LQ777_10190 [Spirosoma oryzicola]